MLKKTILLLIGGLLFSGFLLAQDASNIVVPTAVKNAMLFKFPQTQAVPVTWVKEGANYSGTLLIMQKPAFAVFDSTGKILRVEKRLHISFLPKKIITQMNKQYPNNEILDIYELTDAAGKVTYKITFHYKQTSVFNADGAIEK
jgi:hypothetical protein